MDGGIGHGNQMGGRSGTSFGVPSASATWTERESSSLVQLWVLTGSPTLWYRYSRVRPALFRADVLGYLFACLLVLYCRSGCDVAHSGFHSRRRGAFTCRWDRGRGTNTLALLPLSLPLLAARNLDTLRGPPKKVNNTS